MRTQTYVAILQPLLGFDPQMYALLVTFPDVGWVMPFLRIGYFNGDHVQSGHITHEAAEDYLHQWRTSDKIELTQTG